MSLTRQGPGCDTLCLLPLDVRNLGCQALGLRTYASSPPASQAISLRLRMTPSAPLVLRLSHTAASQGLQLAGSPLRHFSASKPCEPILLGNPLSYMRVCMCACAHVCMCVSVCVDRESSYCICLRRTLANTPGIISQLFSLLWYLQFVQLACSS